MRMLALAGLTGCASLTPERAEEKIEQALIHKVEKKDELHDAVLRVDAPELGVQGAWAAGLAREGEPLTVETPFLSASVGKLFTAAAVLALAERGELSLDDAITEWVEPGVLAGLPVGGGDAALERITLRLLLSHRSGLPDPFDPNESEPVDGASSVFELMMEEPDRSWTREGVLDHVRAHYEPAGAPGETFQYSDAGYELLGLALEGATGLPYPQVVTDEVIEPLGLTRTWYHLHQEPPEGLSYADVWAGELNLAGRACLGADGAGGGLATTTGDLHLLMRALTQGQPVSLDTMAQDWTEDALHRGIDYGLGAWRIRPGALFFMLGAYPDLIGASGMTGSFVYYVPEWDAVISGSFNQTDWQERHLDFLLSEVLPPLHRLR